MLNLTPEDKEGLKAALTAWKAEGVERPLIPIDVDVNGDGKADAFGLDEDGELVIVTDVDVATTVYESTGEGFETEEGESE